MKETDNRRFLISAALLGFGCASYKKLINSFESIDAAANSNQSEISALIGESRTKLFYRVIEHDPVREIDRYHQQGIEIITLIDSNYPAKLLDIYNPPLALFVRGTLDERVRVAIVGTRTPSAYGKAVAREFAQKLAASGVAIVSGLAFGIDAAAHVGALESGSTIAVLPGSLANIQPTGNRELALRIAASDGALISEYPLDTVIQRSNFVIRNRIVSGLSHAVVVVEGTGRSGSLITGRAALAQGRDVYAVPGSIYSLLSAAPHRLLAEGAYLAASPETILNSLPIESSIKQVSEASPSGLNKILSNSPKSIDELSELTGQGVAALAAEIALLEIKNKVTSDPEGRYRLS